MDMNSMKLGAPITVTAEMRDVSWYQENQEAVNEAVQKALANTVAQMEGKPLPYPPPPRPAEPVELRRPPEVCRDEGHDYDDDYWMEDDDTVAIYCSRCHWDHKFRRVE